MHSMEPRSYVSWGKGFASEESVSASDGFARGKNGLMGWELKTPSSFGSNMLVSSQESIDNQGFFELGSPEIMKKELPNGSIRDVFSNKVGGRLILNPVSAIGDAFSVDKESSCKLSSLVVECNCNYSSIIDLKLGRLADNGDFQNFNSSRTTPNLLSAESSMPAKRMRAGALSFLTPFCQVYGCKKDLSSSKNYQKKHKVCEVHSKTAKVIVNGIEQRFCQQCSRFHLLAEFDDGKRSCRKRLAGHNERRRKPHGGIHSGRTGKLLQPCNGSSPLGTAFTTSSFICQGIIPGSLPHLQKYEMNDWCRHVKLEDSTDYNSSSAIPIANGHLHPKSFFPSNAFDKQCLPFHENVIITTTGSKFSETRDVGSNFVLRSLFKNSSMGSEEFAFFNSAPTMISESGRALSLLSSQTSNSPSHSSGIAMVHPLIIPGSHANRGVTPVSEKLIGVRMQELTSGESNKVHLSGINSVETHFDPILISDGAGSVDFGMDGIFQGSEYINSKDHLSCEDGSTIDLLQLSSQLQLVEHQKQSMQGNDALCGLRMT